MTSLQTIQLEQVAFELHHATVGKERALDRLLMGTIVGGTVVLAGPAGVGKSFLAESVARVFGLAARADQATQPGSYTATLELATDGDDAFDGLELLRRLRANPHGNVVVVTSSEPVTLPAAVRDEVMMFVEVPYPNPAEEAQLALAAGTASVDRILDPADLDALRSEALRLRVADEVVHYAVRLVQATRQPGAAGLANVTPLLAHGASPRASIALIRAARGAAMLQGRSEVLVDDVYAVAYEVLIHRIGVTAAAEGRGIGAPDVLVEILGRVSAV